MGEAFDGIDEYCSQFAEDPGYSPDEAHDYIFMMHADDWGALDRAWPERPPAWRVGCGYVLSYGPPGECLPRLIRGMNDTDAAVAKEAALGYAIQILEHEQLANVTEAIQERLAAIVAASVERDVDEVERLLQILREGRDTATCKKIDWAELERSGEARKGPVRQLEPATCDPDDDGWITCPGCGIRWTLRDRRFVTGPGTWEHGCGRRVVKRA
jgi:hypothetical protein